MRAFAVAVLLAAFPAWSQREYVEELEPQQKVDPDTVDLDAPDPADPRNKGKPDKAASTPGPGSAGGPKPDDRVQAKSPPSDAASKTGSKPGSEPGSETGSETGSDGTKPDAASASDALPPRAGPGFEVRETSRAALLEKWNPHAFAARKGDIDKARKLLPDVEHALQDYSVHGVAGGFQARSFGVALAKEAQAAVADGRNEDALALADVAVFAAPDSVFGHSNRAFVRWKSGDLAGSASALLDGLSALSNDPLALSSLVVRALALLAAALLALAVAVYVASVLPSLRLLVFEVQITLPQASHAAHAWALVGLLAVAPWLLGAGPLLSILWGITLTFVYLPRPAQILCLVLGLLLAGLPALFTQIARFQAYPGSRTQRAHEALFELDGEPARVRLKKKEQAGVELELLEGAALAFAARRDGHLEEARTRFEALQKKHPESAFVLGGLGVTLALNGERETALTALGRATELARRDGEPLTWAASAFNASLLHHEANEPDKADALLAGVARRHSELLSGFRRATARGPDETVAHNRAFVDPMPSPFLSREVLNGSADADAVEAALAGQLFWRYRGGVAAGMLLFFPMLWGLLVLVARRLKAAVPCVRCGLPASGRIDGKEVPHSTCAACFHVFVSSASRVDAGVKLRREHLVVGRNKRRARLTWLLAIPCPGAGHLFAGVAGRGALYAFVFGALLAAIAIVLDFPPGPRLAGPWGTNLVAVPLAVVAVVVWLLSLRGARIVADEGGAR